MPFAIPAPYTARPLTASDARAVYEVMVADQLDQIGQVEIEYEDIVGDWQRPSFDSEDSTLGIFLGDELVAYGEHSGYSRGDAAVHPEHRGKGLGTAVAAFMQDKARTRGATVVGMPVFAGGVADRFLESQGYFVRWNSWVLSLPEGASIQERPLPDGYAVGEVAPSQYAEFHGVIEDAFLEWSDRDRQALEDFLAESTQRPGFAPWNLRAVFDADGAIAAAAWLMLTDQRDAYINRLATRRDQRNLGLAQALMVDAFSAGRAHGALTSSLSTDSRTGALGLYEKVGMVVTDNWVHRAITLSPGS